MKVSRQSGRMTGRNSSSNLHSNQIYAVLPIADIIFHFFFIFSSDGNYIVMAHLYKVTAEWNNFFQTPTEIRQTSMTMWVFSATCFGNNDSNRTKIYHVLHKADVKGEESRFSGVVINE